MMKYALPFTAFLLASCSAIDMQGVDPKDYYAAHPIKNKVELRTRSVDTRFEPRASKLSSVELDRLSKGLRGVSPVASDAVRVELSDDDLHNSARRAYLSRLMRSLGYEAPVSFVTAADLARDDIRVLIDYAGVIAPDCPDWRRSPITTYSNTAQGNYGCAHEVNLGLMVADPHDLVQGSSHVPPDTAERNARVLQEYRAGITPGGQGDSGSQTQSGDLSGSTTSAISDSVEGLTGTSR